jgi:hypothetical protein
VASVPVLRGMVGEAHIELGPPGRAILHYRTSEYYTMDRVQKPRSPTVKTFTHVETVVQDEATHRSRPEEGVNHSLVESVHSLNHNVYSVCA